MPTARVALGAEMVGNDAGGGRHEGAAAERLDEPGSSRRGMLGANPQHSEATVKMAAETPNTFLRPYMSLILPAIGMAMTWPSA